MTKRTVAELVAELVDILPTSATVSFSVADMRELLAAEVLHAEDDAANDTTVLVAEAAELAGVSEETVRRAVRNEEIPDLRSNPKGTIRVRTRDIDFLKGKARSKRERQPPGEYDPVAHARRLRRN